MSRNTKLSNQITETSKALEALINSTVTDIRNTLSTKTVKGYLFRKIADGLMADMKLYQEIGTVISPVLRADFIADSSNILRMRATGRVTIDTAIDGALGLIERSLTVRGHELSHGLPGFTKAATEYYACSVEDRALTLVEYRLKKARLVMSAV